MAPTQLSTFYHPITTTLVQVTYIASLDYYDSLLLVRVGWKGTPKGYAFRLMNKKIVSSRT
jgi:hypothetical protein